MLQQKPLDVPKLFPDVGKVVFDLGSEIDDCGFVGGHPLGNAASPPDAAGYGKREGDARTCQREPRHQGHPKAERAALLWSIARFVSRTL